jgi:hypothetical protein
MSLGMPQRWQIKAALQLAEKQKRNSTNGSRRMKTDLVFWPFLVRIRLYPFESVVGWLFFSRFFSRWGRLRPSGPKGPFLSRVAARLKRLLKKSSLLAIRPSATKVAVDNDALTARLKPCPFKDRANREFFSSL